LGTTNRMDRRKANETLTLANIRVLQIQYFLHDSVYWRRERHRRSKIKKLAAKRDHWYCRRDSVSKVSSFS
jgi:hypothetical protein